MRIKKPRMYLLGVPSFALTNLLLCLVLNFKILQLTFHFVFILKKAPSC
jgi:hypothetical protein